jgi:hypothetical protein
VERHVSLWNVVSVRKHYTNSTKRICLVKMNRISCVMVSMLASSAVDRGFEP